jgi:hypothetical protein
MPRPKKNSVLEQAKAKLEAAFSLFQRTHVDEQVAISVKMLFSNAQTVVKIVSVTDYVLGSDQYS